MEEKRLENCEDNWIKWKQIVKTPQPDSLLLFNQHLKSAVRPIRRKIYLHQARDAREILNKSFVTLNKNNCVEIFKSPAARRVGMFEIYFLSWESSSLYSLKDSEYSIRHAQVKSSSPLSNL